MSAEGDVRAWPRLAGLAHAVYGTDGFDLALLDPADRTTPRVLIGESAERLVHLYGACDRDRTWPRRVSASSCRRLSGRCPRPTVATGPQPG